MSKRILVLIGIRRRGPSSGGAGGGKGFKNSRSGGERRKLRRDGFHQRRLSPRCTPNRTWIWSTGRRTRSAIFTICSTSSLRRSTRATGCGSWSRSSICGKFMKLLQEKTWDIIVNTHFLPAEIIASLRRKEKFATPQLDRHDRFRNASPVGQSAVRSLLHGHRGRLAQLAILGRAGQGHHRDRHSHRSGLQRGERPRRLPASGKDSRAIGRSSCNWAADSASGRSKNFSAASWNSKSRWRSSSSPAATKN